MRVPDRVLLESLSEAAEGRRIVVLTSSPGHTDIAVNRAKELGVKAMGETHYNRLFLTGSSLWHIKVPNKGWVFFFPKDDLSPGEEIENTDIVFLQEDDAYIRITYDQWRTNTAPKPIRPRTLWERLRED